MEPDADQQVVQGVPGGWGVGEVGGVAGVLQVAGQALALRSVEFRVGSVDRVLDITQARCGATGRRARWSSSPAMLRA